MHFFLFTDVFGCSNCLASETDKLMSTGHCLPEADRVKLQYMCHFTAYGFGIHIVTV